MVAAPHPVILDGDPGLDDAVAWLMALASPELWVMGITAVHGNVVLPLSLWNTGVILSLAGEIAGGVPYFGGADRPLVRDTITATRIHGSTGLPAEGLPDPARDPASPHAIDFIIRQVRANPGKVTLVCTGPLTNVALAFRIAPDIPDLIKEVVWMGGSTGQGNRSPAAEYNALADPHAARIVLESVVRVRMVGLNVTMQCVATPPRIAQLRAIGNRASLACAEMLEFYADIYRQAYGLSGGALHDPLAVASVIRPELLIWQDMRVDIDTQEGLNFGRTVCDMYGVSGKEPNAIVAVDVNDEAFFDLLFERLAGLP